MFATSIDMLSCDIANSFDTTNHISSCQHDNANAAVLSLLLLGSSKSLDTSEFDDTKSRSWKRGDEIIVKTSCRGTRETSTDCKHDDLKNSTINSIPKHCIDAEALSRGNQLIKKTECTPDVGHICATALRGVNQDLSNALLSSSLVLGSLSKSRGEKYLSGSQGDAKRRRGILLPPSSRVGHDKILCFPSSEPSPIDFTEKKTEEVTPTIAATASNIKAADTNDEKKQNHSSSRHKESKERKNSAERYRQRNHRRKQFFGNKIVKVVELLVKYREMMSLKVRDLIPYP